jgi:phosphatidate cytidylyltransferase
MPDFLRSNPSLQRWFTGAFIGLPVLACVAAGPPWCWYLLVSVATAIGLWELHGLLFHDLLSRKWQSISFAAGLLMPLGTYLWGITGLNLALFASFFAALLIMMISTPIDCDEIGRIALLSFAWLYLPYCISFVILVGDAPQGRYWILLVLAVIVAGDAGAYHVGTRIGRHKLYEIVSPKKSVEGSIGGLSFSLLTGTILGSIFFRNLPLAKLLLCTVLVASAGQVGDLIESMLKRNCGKKDSGRLLPGHGGILDRLDSIIFAFPVMWALLKWVAADRWNTF